MGRTATAGRPPDAELVTAARDGDRDAFAALITRHWSTAVALATRLLGSADLGGDAVQEATITALTGLGRLRSPDRFGAWFCGITLNVARRWRRQLGTEHPATLPDLTTAEPGPHERAELAELAAEVRAAVAALADGQRDAVMLFYLQGLTHREVAAELSISVGAVKARLHQARGMLAPRLTSLAGRAALSSPAAEPPTTGALTAGPEATGPQTTGPLTMGSLTTGRLTTGPEATGPGSTGPFTTPAGPVPSAAAGPAQEETAMTDAGQPGWIDVTVTEVRRGEDGEPPQPVHVMVLSETGGPRQLPIWIGGAEATALALSLEAHETPRPFTYQLAVSLLEAAGAQVAEARITRIAGKVFYATVRVTGPAGTQEVDARPSDAVNLAVATGAPIRVDAGLLDDPAVTGGHGRTPWQEFPEDAADLVARLAERMAAMAHADAEPSGPAPAADPPSASPAD